MRDDELLRKYLLGELSDEDAALLEARLIQDGELFESAEALEADLLEEHAHGGLSAGQSVRLRRHLASSDASRSQLAMVQGLGTVAQERPDRRVLTGPWGRTALSRAQVRALAAAAMLAIAVPSVWLASKTARLPEQKGAIAAATPTPEPTPVPTPAQVDETPVQDEIAEVEPTPEPAPPEPRTVVSYAFQLALTAFRGAEDHATELHIPAGTERVDIQLPLSREDETRPSFQVVLRNLDDGTELIRRADLRPVRSGEHADLVLPVEAKLLRAGRYSVEVYGEDEDDPVGFPEFQVVEPRLK